MKRMVLYKALLIVLIAIIPFMVCIAYWYVRLTNNYEKILYWQDVSDFDEDLEFDTVTFLRFIPYEGVMRTYVNVDFAKSADIRVGPLLSSTEVLVKKVDLTDAENSILIASNGDIENIGQIAVYKRNVIGKYKRIELPVPEFDKASEKYRVGYDIYVLNVKKNVVTVGNEEKGINAEFQIEDREIVNAGTETIRLSQLYQYCLEGEPIGANAWQTRIESNEEGEYLEMYIRISPKENIDVHTVIVTLEYNMGKWHVVDAEIMEELSES